MTILEKLTYLSNCYAKLGSKYNAEWFQIRVAMAGYSKREEISEERLDREINAVRKLIKNKPNNGE